MNSLVNFPFEQIRITSRQAEKIISASDLIRNKHPGLSESEYCDLPVDQSIFDELDFPECWQHSSTWRHCCYMASYPERKRREDLQEQALAIKLTDGKSLGEAFNDIFSSYK